jgi:hypothetical protein
VEGNFSGSIHKLPVAGHVPFYGPRHHTYFYFKKKKGGEKKKEILKKSN